MDRRIIKKNEQQVDSKEKQKGEEKPHQYAISVFLEYPFIC